MLEDWEISVKSLGKMGKYFCPHFLHPFLENIDRRSCPDGCRGLFQYTKTLNLSFGGGSYLGEYFGAL